MFFKTPEPQIYTVRRYNWAHNQEGQQIKLGDDARSKRNVMKISCTLTYGEGKGETFYSNYKHWNLNMTL